MLVRCEGMLHENPENAGEYLLGRKRKVYEKVIPRVQRGKDEVVCV